MPDISMACFPYVQVGAWSPCSARCGGGWSNRDVRCMRLGATAVSSAVEVPLEECPLGKLWLGRRGLCWCQPLFSKQPCVLRNSLHMQRISTISSEVLFVPHLCLTGDVQGAQAVMLRTLAVATLCAVQARRHLPATGAATRWPVPRPPSRC